MTTKHAETTLKRLIAAMFAALAFGIFTAPGASAAVLTISSGGLLTGAKGVSIAGKSYDVEFLEGTCASLFSGCNANLDFDFPDEATAEAASQALIDQVFVDSALGNFDTVPSLTAGCGLPDSVFSECEIYIPVNMVIGASSPRFLSFGVVNLIDDGRLDPRGGLVIDRFYRGQLPINYEAFDTGRGRTFARFSEAAVVPLPASGWALLAGFGALAAIRRRIRS